MQNDAKTAEGCCIGLRCWYVYNNATACYTQCFLIWLLLILNVTLFILMHLRFNVKHMSAVVGGHLYLHFSLMCTSHKWKDATYLSGAIVGTDPVFSVGLSTLFELLAPLLLLQQIIADEASPTTDPNRELYAANNK